jgi:pimeloyl-ACP methyl ester carboxylesterase
MVTRFLSQHLAVGAMLFTIDKVGLVFRMIFASALLYAATATASPLRPLVLIPGILGSQLCLGDLVVWGRVNSLNNLPTLELRNTGNPDIRPCGILKNVQILGPLITSHYYDGLLKELKSLGYMEDRDLFIFDYDWRQSNLDSAAKLKQFIDARIPKEKQFDIIAHSMGGIVTKIFVADGAQSTRINNIIYLGTPFLGSANALGTLSEGWGSFENVLAGGKQAIRRVVLSWPGFLELLPRYGECCRMKKNDNSYVTFDPLKISTWTTYKWLPTELSTGVRFDAFRTALERSASLNGILASPAPTGITEILFAGEGHLTRHRLGMLEGQTSPSDNSWTFRREPGDGTVPIWSAARDPDQRSAAKALPSFEQHATIFDDKWVQAELGRILTQIGPSSKEPISSRGRPAIIAMINGKEVLWSIEGAELSVSPATVRMGQDIEVQLLVSIDKRARVASGVFLPSISVIAPEREILLVAKEVTTDADIDDRQLRFVTKMSAARPSEMLEVQARITSSFTASANVLVLE